MAAESNTGSPLDDALSRAKTALRESHAVTLRRLKLTEGDQAGQIHISGRVNSSYQKQLAQELVRHVATGIRVYNHVRVDPVDPVEDVEACGVKATA